MAIGGGGVGSGSGSTFFGRAFRRVTTIACQAFSNFGVPGFTPVAAQDRARVLRFVNGGSMNFTVDVRSIVRQGEKDKDMVLQPNDVVFVPQSLF